MSFPDASTAFTLDEHAAIQQWGEPEPWDLCFIIATDHQYLEEVAEFFCADPRDVQWLIARQTSGVIELVRTEDGAVWACDTVAEALARIDEEERRAMRAAKALRRSRKAA